MDGWIDINISYVCGWIKIVIRFVGRWVYRNIGQMG